MKSIPALILLIALLAQFANRYIVMLNYELNKDFIAKVLCVNRDKPMSGCNGKCFLKKQLEKSSKENNAPTGNKQETANEILFFTEHKKMTTSFFDAENSRQYLRRQQHFTPQQLYRAVFHPPQGC